MEAALGRTSGDDRDSFVAIINADQDLKKCVSNNLLEAPAPTPSPLPDSQTQVVEGCTDIAPDDVYTCEKQKEFGKCDNTWMINGGYCQKSCGRCEQVPTPSPVVAETCNDVAPDDVYTCEQQQKFGKCDNAWMVTGGFCRQTCGRCVVDSTQLPQVYLQNPPVTIHALSHLPNFYCYSQVYTSSGATSLHVSATTGEGVGTYSQRPQLLLSLIIFFIHRNDYTLGK
eukprot:TRINITY_DN11809_c0_g1_i1.p2 TRINITY_DN11809_c0_g1~~TRINITY_DN11809_c0_g1_i1.p2  ORF type:complete len:249 (+),score=23.79 TRINITY_DN11809_c0_g1_i1:68-748(+)